jgi:PTS system N-acetylgalactosamine-specific IIC component
VSVPFFFEEITLLALLAGVLAVDERAGWQGMFSQPVVSSAVVGLLLGELIVGMSVGVVLELVWLSILPMRGTRRPDAVAGAIVGAGTACMLVRHTGDARFVYIIALGAVLGLAAGELSGTLGRRIHRVRDRRLGRFDPNTSGRSLQRRLVWYSLYSFCFVVGSEFVLVGVMLPVSAVVANWLTAVAGESFATGARWWADIVPVLGAGALMHMYWHKNHNRYLILCAGVTLLLLWLR